MRENRIESGVRVLKRCSAPGQAEDFSSRSARSGRRSQASLCQWMCTEQNPAARDRIIEARKFHEDPKSLRRILLISGAARSNQTCPGETPKTYRLAQMARPVIVASTGCECDFLDLSLLTAEYGKQILPCKACVATLTFACSMGTTRPSKKQYGRCVTCIATTHPFH